MTHSTKSDNFSLILYRYNTICHSYNVNPLKRIYERDKCLIMFQSFVIVVSCGEPPIPSNGAITGKYTYKSIVNVTCNNGYKLFGTYQLTCKSNGAWNDAPGVCTGENYSITVS